MQIPPIGQGGQSQAPNTHEVAHNLRGNGVVASYHEVFEPSDPAASAPRKGPAGLYVTFATGVVAHLKGFPMQVVSAQGTVLANLTGGHFMPVTGETHLHTDGMDQYIGFDGTTTFRPHVERGDAFTKYRVQPDGHAEIRPYSQDGVQLDASTARAETRDDRVVILSEDGKRVVCELTPILAMRHYVIPSAS